ncbi:acyltransferase domain-containing protein, partial [Mycobacterium riyadhense]
MERVEQVLIAELAGITPCSGEVAFYSTVNGGLMDTAELDGRYWYQNVRQTVQFESAIQQLAAHGHSVFIEASAHPVMLAGIEQTLPGVVA